MEDISRVKSHVLVSDPDAVWTDSELLKLDDQMIMVKCSNEKTALNNHTVVDICTQVSTEGEHGGPLANNNNSNTTNNANDQEPLEDEGATAEGMPIRSIYTCAAPHFILSPLSRRRANQKTCSQEAEEAAATFDTRSPCHQSTHNKEMHSPLDQSSPFADVMEDLTWGESLKVDGQMITVKCSNEKMVMAKTSGIHLKDPNGSVGEREELSIHEPGAIEILSSRYHMNEIYTYIGQILIATNPFQSLPNLYNVVRLEEYREGKRSPHPYAVADRAYRFMLSEERSQSILVSGMSGSGKTRVSELIIRYLDYVGGKAASEGRDVENKLLQYNTILEAFGSAKTITNDNSSRFGKFVEVQFDLEGKISGAFIRTYLLERSRVCHISDQERNYHCFYMLCAAPPQEVERYELAKPGTFHYLNQSNCFEIEGVVDSESYDKVIKAMNTIGFTSKEQNAIFRIVAAILHLGNVEFGAGNDECPLKIKDVKSRFHLTTTANLLMCEEKDLEYSLYATRVDRIVKYVDLNAANGRRDELAKILYSRLFDWLVNKINAFMGQDRKSKFFIGVLEEYFKEETVWDCTGFTDNQEVIDPVEKKSGGIIDILDEACMLGRSSHKTFGQNLYQTSETNKRFGKPDSSDSDFTFCHYAGDVTYQTRFFMDNNKVSLVTEQNVLLSASKCSVVAELFPRLSSKQSKPLSVDSIVKRQSQSLLDTMSATGAHYIRCVKPNSSSVAGTFHSQYVLLQLRYGGIIEAFTSGYIKRTFNEIIERFGIFDEVTMARSGSFNEITMARRIMKKIDLQCYQRGKEKVFLCDSHMTELDYRIQALRKAAAATVIQTFFRGRHLKQVNHNLCREDTAAAASFIQLTLLNNNEVQALQSDREIPKTNLNKAEEVKSLFEENRTLDKAKESLPTLLDKERKHRSESEHSASNFTKNSDGIIDQPRSNHLALDIPPESKELENIRDDQKALEDKDPKASEDKDPKASEDKDPIDLDPEDKGLFNFLKPVSDKACTCLYGFNGVCFALAYSKSNDLQIITIGAGTMVYFFFSLATVGVVGSLEGRAKDIDFATVMVLAQLAYVFADLCVACIFLANCPWFIVFPFLLVWLFAVCWIVWRFRRPRRPYDWLSERISKSHQQ